MLNLKAGNTNLLKPGLMFMLAGCWVLVFNNEFAIKRNIFEVKKKIPALNKNQSIRVLVTFKYWVYNPNCEIGVFIDYNNTLNEENENNNKSIFFDVYIMLIFGLIGICMKWLDMPVVPLLLALVLGSQFEENLRVALTASQGDISVFVTSPISLSFIILSLISVIWSLKSNKNKKQSNDA